jgi:hypothetical protein
MTDPAVLPVIGTEFRLTARGALAVASCGVPATACAAAGNWADVTRDMIAIAAMCKLLNRLSVSARRFGFRRIVGPSLAALSALP